MAYKIYQKLQSGMANQGLLDAADVDVLEDGQRVTLAAKLSDLSEDVAGMAEDVSDAVAVADGIKTAQGQEVGDVAETDIAEGVLIWHGGKLYRVLSLIAAGDRWQDMDVTETTVSEEINAMRGVSSESVYLTIQPTSAIPQEGVTARIYNIKTQTYMTEETILPSANRVHLGDVPFGDDYTIIVPEIEGYTKPADMTFKAGQMIRERTATYTESLANIECLVIKASCSNNAAIGNYSVTVKLYDGQGNVAQTINKSIEGGTSEEIQIPYGTQYSVTFPAISGYLTPREMRTTARASHRVLKGNYVLLLAEVQFVVKNNDTGDFEYYTTDYDLTGKSIFGMAIVTSTLHNGNGEFIIRINCGTQTKQYWTKPIINVPSATDMYNGESNSAAALQAIADYEADNSGTTVLSIFKATNSINSGITVNGIAVKYFVAAPYQAKYILDNATQLNNLWRYYYPTQTLVSVENDPYKTSAQSSANNNYQVSKGESPRDGYSKDAFSSGVAYGHLICLPLLTTFDLPT